MSREELYKEIVDLEGKNRQTGRTTRIAKMVREDPQGVLVCFSETQARSVNDQFGVDTISIYDLNKLKGTNKVPYFDHTIIYTLAESGLHEARKEIQQSARECKSLFDMLNLIKTHNYSNRDLDLSFKPFDDPLTLSIGFLCTTTQQAWKIRFSDIKKDLQEDSLESFYDSFINGLLKHNLSTVSGRELMAKMLHKL